MTTKAEHPYDPEVVELLTALGRAYLENGENQRAAEKFRQLVKNGIEDAKVLNNFALALARAESMNEEAFTIYRMAVDADEQDESLYLTLATLFLKKNMVADPALKVYRRSLKFAPPFEDQIRAALEKVIKESPDTLTFSELREILLECGENPELLTLYLDTAWRHFKFDDALQVLRDLYQHSNHNPSYLKMICETLLEKKAHSEEGETSFEIAPVDIQLCLQYKKLDEPIRRLGEVEAYLDLKNLFLNVKPTARKKLPANDEYEFFILEQSQLKKEMHSDNNVAPADIDPTFDFMRDFVERVDRNGRAVSETPEFVQVMSRSNTLGIFEITNFDDSASSSKLPFASFLKFISKELTRANEAAICSAENGIVIFNTDPDKLLQIGVATLNRLERYNQVVEDSEKIRLRISLHCSLVPFLNLGKANLRELRKAFKVHSLPTYTELSGSNSTGNLPILFTESVASAINVFRTHRLGEYRLRHFPNPQKIFAIASKETKEAAKPRVTAEPPLASKPQKFGKYDVLQTIKEVQLHSTFKGYDPQLERRVVIKAYRTQAFAGFKDFPSLRLQFYEEVRKLNRINHPNIAVIYDAGEEGDILYLVRELIEGEILNNYLLRDGLPDINKTIELYRQICKILIVHHESQIWHKNLKPDNVFITAQGEIKIADSGLLQVRHTEKVWNDDINSQAYSAPEQIQGSTITPGCDIFQLGVMLYESLTGVHPFRGKNAREVRVKILADEVVPPSQFRADIPEGLDKILIKTLAKTPNYRYSTIQEFSSELKRLFPASKETTSKRLMEVLK
jgi:tetratricopeptide (TPR) repeat protein